MHNPHHQPSAHQSQKPGSLGVWEQPASWACLPTTFAIKPWVPKVPSPIVFFFCHSTVEKGAGFQLPLLLSPFGHPLIDPPLLRAAFCFFTSLPPTWHQGQTPQLTHTLGNGQVFASFQGHRLSHLGERALSRTPTPKWSCQPPLSLGTCITPFGDQSPQRCPLPYPPPLLSLLLPPPPALLPGHPFARVIYRSKR